MQDGDWYLGYPSYDGLPGAALTFGRDRSGIPAMSEPEIAFSDPDVGDAPLPGEDGVRLGRDYQRSATVSFELGVDAVDYPVDRKWPRGDRWLTSGEYIGGWPEENNELPVLGMLRTEGTRETWAQDGVNMLRQVWRADSLRDRPGEPAWLSHRTGGRTRRLFGRPRKFAVAHSRFARQGFIPVVADFVTVDDRFYDETRQTAELWDYSVPRTMWRPGRPGAFEEWVASHTRKKVQIAVGGRLPTHPVIVMHGPCKNPKLTVHGLWAVQLSLVLKAGEHVTIDASPWYRNVTKTAASGARSAVGTALTRASPRLAKMAIPPGRWDTELAYSRTGTTYPEGTGPRIEIKWRDAHAWW
ncbi:hypothetical protein ACLQ2N_32480 [Streptomyces sp. DT224]|uniref:hypothetical protein n=1 Tax=Streptomyces sp. DT224 TaxID=3393426 RepID=UPI003CF6D96F